MQAEKSQIPNEPLTGFLLALADDELVLGHRDSEWTGHGPILEEDIAWSNISQDEIGHSLVWYTLLEPLTGKTPDESAFERSWRDFTCCHLVAYPRSDFAYTVVRQYLFDVAEIVRLESLLESSNAGIRAAASKILREETYHLMHTKGLVERLGDATEESHRRMQRAADEAFPQSLGLFETLQGEKTLVDGGVFPGNAALKNEWLSRVVPVMNGASLKLPCTLSNGKINILCDADEGGRRRSHQDDLKQLIDDFQTVYRSIPGGNW